MIVSGNPALADHDQAVRTNRGTDRTGETRQSLSILEDPSGELTLEQIRNDHYSGSFERIDSQSISFGFTDSVYWAQFKLENHSDQPRHLILEIAYPLLDHLSLLLLSICERKHGARASICF